MQMGWRNCSSGNNATGASLAIALTATLLFVFAAPAQATPIHPRKEVLDVGGLNHACGAAVDSKGDLYLSSAGDSRIKVYDPSHNLLAEIKDENTPCSLAVTSTGNLYVSEKATGEVVRFKPNAYPFAGTPTYGAREVIDASGLAKGIAVDRFDGRLYVAEGTRVAAYKSDGSFEANIGEGTLTEASGVAAFTYAAFPSGIEKRERSLWVADAKGLAADRLYLFGTPEINTLKLRRELDGSTTPDGSFGFGAAGAYLAEDPGNRALKGECKVVGEQACTGGHLLLYDAAHKALDEFDATGEYLDRTVNASFADAEPTAIAIDRSGGSGDGTIYVTAGAGTGARALAFGPLKAPSRKALAEPLSHVLKSAQAVATDSRGDVYVATPTAIRIFAPNGTQITEFPETLNAKDLAVDSTGKLYVLDEGKNGFAEEVEVSYYTPSKYPPDSKTTYTRREEAVVFAEDFPSGSKSLRGIAINPGPAAGKDRLFVTSGKVTRLFDSAANGSGVLNETFGSCITGGFLRESLAIDGSKGIIYLGGNLHLIFAIDATSGECLRRFEPTGLSSGTFGSSPFIAVDQANGHVVEFDGENHSAREYDGAGAFVAEFGTFTEGLVAPYRVAVDSSCALHEPPLDETTTPTCKEFDPANGNVYIAFDDTKAPFDVSAFGPLEYPPPEKHELTVKKTGTGSGKVTSSPAGIDCGSTCTAEFLETDVVKLTVIPDPENNFVGWSGCEAEPSATECEVTMSKDREVTAEFESIGEKKPLSVIVEGLGSGKVTSSPPGINCPSACTEEFGKGVTVILKAIANKGFEFVGWSGCDAEPLPTECEVTMSGSREIKAKFDVEHPLLTVEKKGTGSGKVTSSPAGIDCGFTCSHKFNLEEKVTLTATESKGSIFDGWSGSGCSGTGTCVVTMSEAKKVTSTFTALPQAVVKPAQPILYHEATLRGEVDPAGLVTEYRFEYLTEEQYEENGETFEGAQHTAMKELGAGKGFVAVAAPLAGLEEGTRYRFGLRTMNSVGEADDEGTFETLQRPASLPCANAAYRIGLSANLPDCRAYELVTPGQTDGLKPYAAKWGTSASQGVNNWLTVQRGEGAGERLSYFTDGTLPGFEGSGILDGYTAERKADDHPPGGWQSRLFSPTYTQTAPGLKASPFQLGVAADQRYSVWDIRHEPETFPDTLAEGVYLRTPTGFEALAKGSLGTDLGALRRYVGAGGAHAIFTSTKHIEPAAPPASVQAIYDRAAGAAVSAVVSTPPVGASPSLKATFESSNASFAGASEDGAAVVFSVADALYLHRGGATVQIADAPNTFAGISEDGTRVFYAATSKGESAAALFACDASVGPCAGPGAHPADKIAASGIFAGVSPDGSHALFSSTEALTGGEENDNGETAKAAVPNLYVWGNSETSFLGGLPAADFESFSSVNGMNLAAWTRAIGFSGQLGRAFAPTRSTPDGEVFVFQSHARLTAYDNKGAGEIYRYDPAAEAGERLLCVSCDPSGAPPSADALLEDIRGFTSTPIWPETMIANLTDDGQRVFFQSLDRLLPEDANEAEDVYEWQVQGSGGCTRSGGCLALISSGQGETPSILYAMSADGTDVFFQTKEKLVGADFAGSPSIYDAREGGGIPEPTEKAPCQGDACQGQGSEPPVLPTPSTTGSGESGESSPPRPCAKGKHRVKGRCVSIKKHKHRKHHRRRAHAKRGGNR